MNPSFASSHIQSTRRFVRTSARVLLVASLIAGALSLTAASPRQKQPSGFVTPTLGTYPGTSMALSTNTTVTPSAAPTNTTSINVSTETNFKGKLEADPATGVVRVTDAHPAGTYVITVKAFDSGGGSASAAFNLTVTTVEACDPPSFASATNFGTSDSPISVAVGDFNGDGKQDFATANLLSSNVSIRLGDGAGSFGAASNFGVGGQPFSIAVGDFNGDGKQDLVTANGNANNVSILLGDGTGGFGSATDFALGVAFPYAVAVGDFNGDGRQDLAVANYLASVAILLGDGTGSFGVATFFFAGNNIVSLAVGDFNRDGKQDLAVVGEDGAPNALFVLLGDGTGSFGAPSSFAAGNYLSSVAVGDFNGDGKQDLATSDQANSVSILKGDGAGSFSAATPFYTGSASQPLCLAVGDFNGDGKQDLAVGLGPPTVLIMLGDGAGNLGPPIPFGVGPLQEVIVRSVAVGDFNGDGKQDLAVTNQGADSVSILLDTCSLTLGTYPDSSIPLSTNTTVTPDAPPAGITSINVSSSTDFKGKLEGDPATGVVRVTDAHPAGTHTVTVTGFSSTGVRTSTTFALTVTTPDTCNPVSFAAATNFGTGTNPSAVAVGDFNRDGQQDLAVAHFSSSFVSILLGNGAGNFTPGTNVPAAAVSNSSVAVGDFNGDGKQDLAVAHYSGPTAGILIFLGDGAGNFGAGTNLPAHGGPVSVVVGDFNRDGRPDLAAANQDSNDLSILLGNGDGTFSAAVNFSVGLNPQHVTTGDFDADGKPDLAVANYFSGNVSILLGDGAGGFGAATNFDTDAGPTAIAVGDFNGDGQQDLAVANYASNNISIRLGDGMGGFSAATNVNTNTLPLGIAMGDFNGDGAHDLAVANVGSNNVSLFLGDGAGMFGIPINLGTGTGPWAVAVGDFTGDGKQDLAVANLQSNDVSLLLRDCTVAPTSVVSRKTHGGAGTFDIDLSLSGLPGTLGIECRSGGATNDHQLIVTYPVNVTVNGNPQAQVTSGTGVIGSGGTSNGGVVLVNENTVTIPLTNVTNRQIINVTLYGVDGGGDLIISMGVLVGDSTGKQSRQRLGREPDQGALRRSD